MIPSREECYKLIEEYHLPKHIQRHCEKVRDVAVFLAEKLKGEGEPINIELIDRASLLHDLIRICNIDKLNDSFFDEPLKGKELEKLKAIKLRYEQVHHADACYDIINKKYPEIASIIRKHKFLSIIDPKEKPKTWEEKLVYYADKRVKHDRIVTLKHRLDDGHKRNAKIRGLKRNREADNKNIELESEIFKKLDFKADDMKKVMER